MKLALDVLIALLFCLSLAGLGAAFLKRVLKISVDFFSGFFVGCGLVLPVLFAFGLFGFFNTAFFVIFAVFLIPFAIAGSRSILKVRIRFTKSMAAPLLILAVILLINGLASLSPPIKDDTLFYNLGLPKMWAAQEGISFLPTVPLSASALNSEILITPILALGSPEAAQFFIFLIGAMTMFLVARRLIDHLQIDQSMVLVLFGSVAAYMAIIVNAKNDFLCIGFSAMAIFYYFDYLNNKDLKYILLMGAFAGLAAGTKTNALILIAAVFAAMVMMRHQVKVIFAFVLSSTVFALPWLLKAYFETGNPVYPFYNGMFHSPYWHDIFDSYNSATYVDMDRKGLVNFITSPIRLMFSPDIFRARLGPAPIMFLPLIFFVKNVPAIIKKSFVVIGIFYLLWYLVLPNARYLFPILPLMIIIAAFVASYFMSKSAVIKSVMIGGLCLLLALTGIQGWRDGKNRAKTSLGIIDRDYFLNSETVLDPNDVTQAKQIPALPYLATWNYLDIHSDPADVVGILCSNWSRADGFYLKREFIYLNPSEQIVVDFTKSKSEMKESLIANSTSFLLVDDWVVKEFSEDPKFAAASGFEVLSRGVSNLLDLIEENGRIVYSSDRFHLYKMRF